MLIHIRYNKGQLNNGLFARYRNLEGKYYNFVSSQWDLAESPNSKQFLYEISDDDPYESTYNRNIVTPVDYDEFVVIEVVVNSTGEVLGQDNLISYLSYSLLDKLKFDEDGNVVVSSVGGIFLPTMTGSMYTPTLTWGTTTKVVQFDTPTLTFNLNGDYTAWVPKLYYRKDTGQSIMVKDCEWIDATIGHGSLDFSSVETSQIGNYLCELKLIKDLKIITMLKFALVIQEGLGQ